MNIKAQIINFAKRSKSFSTKDLVDKFGKSRQYISKLLSELAEGGELIKTGSTKDALYTHISRAQNLDLIFKESYENKNLEEHIVLEALKAQFQVINILPEHVQSIFDYAFSEMFNNAIDHSKSKTVDVTVRQLPGKIKCSVRDKGIGVFRNVMKKAKLKSELDSMRELLKGKLTTQPQAHSGEGIFFTSKACDQFILNSYEYQMKIDNELPDIFFGELKKSMKGTEVVFEIKTDHKAHLSDVFKAYYTDPEEPAFDKTTIHIELYTMGTIYISRSQAKRVLNRCEKFKTVILDFANVPSVGQAFADEIFRVFQLKHPNVQILPINMNKAVKFMIDRVEKP